MGSRPPAAGWAQHSTLKERVPAIPYTPDEGQQAETGSVKHGLASHFSSLALATRVTRSYTYKLRPFSRTPYSCIEYCSQWPLNLLQVPSAHVPRPSGAALAIPLQQA